MGLILLILVFILLRLEGLTYGQVTQCLLQLIQMEFIKMENQKVYKSLDRRDGNMLPGNLKGLPDESFFLRGFY